MKSWVLLNCYQISGINLKKIMFDPITKLVDSLSQLWKMNIEEKIKAALKEVYGSTKTSTTTISAIVDIVTVKYIETKPYEVKEALGQMKGWKRTGQGLLDQAEIDPSFFE